MGVPIYFEDLVIGDSFVTDEVTVDDEEMLTYNRRNDPWPFHVDEASAAHNPYGGLIAGDESHRRDLAPTVTLVAEINSEYGTPASPPLRRVAIATVFENPLAGKAAGADLKPLIVL